jgi:nucleoside-diphosphate-sugar epimerase
VRLALVTGGTGFLGAGLVRELVRRGWRVRVLDNQFRGRTGRLADVSGEVELIEGDVRDPSVVLSAARGAQWLFHLAFINGTRHFYERPDLVLDVGLRGALNTVDAARTCGVERYILASSSEVYQEPTHVPTSENERMIVPDPRNARYTYGAAKIASELLALHTLQRGGVQAVIVRPHNLYGPDMGQDHVIAEFGMRLASLSAVSTGAPVAFPIEGTGSETRAFCYIDDAVRGVLTAAERGAAGEIYNVGVTDEISIADLARRMAAVFGVDIALAPQPIRAGSTPRRCPDISKLRQLGYAPAVPLSEGLRLTCAWYREAQSRQPVGS